MKNFLKRIIIEFVFVLLIISSFINTYATDINSNISSDELQKYISNVNDAGAIDLMDMYAKLSEKYSNQEIANMIEENKEEIIDKTDVDEKSFDTGVDVLRSLDTEETKKILQEDLDIEQIKEKIDSGATINEIVKEIQREIPTSKQASIAIKILLASSIVKTALIVLGILLLYKIIIRWIVFKKAGRHGWATIIPIYNEITYLKVCGISPWWFLLVFIPILGWIVYGILKLFARFSLSISFGKGLWFGFGLLLLGIIFETILAFNKNIRYVEDE